MIPQECTFEEIEKASKNRYPLSLGLVFSYWVPAIVALNPIFFQVIINKSMWANILFFSCFSFCSQFVVYIVSDIDTTKETFKADLQLSLSWVLMEQEFDCEGKKGRFYFSSSVTRTINHRKYETNILHTHPDKKAN